MDSFDGNGDGRGTLRAGSAWWGLLRSLWAEIRLVGQVGWLRWWRCPCRP
jgi:hypothetical protein